MAISLIARASPKPLHVIVVGAGLGGLATAVALRSSPILPKPTVTILESASRLLEFGAGIQVAPNVVRILHSFGLAEPLLHCGVRPVRNRQLRWSDGTELTRWPVNEDNSSRNAFGFEYYTVHRPDLHRMLLDKAHELGATILTGHEVVGYGHDGNSCAQNTDGTGGDRQDDMPETVVCKNGAVFKSHIVVAADGAKSKLSGFVLEDHIPAIPTGDSAWRGMLRREQIMGDPDLASLELDKGNVLWLGPDRHVVGYFVRSGEMYNMVVLVPDDEVDDENWKLQGDMQKLRAQFQDWDLRLRKLLSKIESSCIWNLRDRPQLERWLHLKGNLVLLGDAAHPMLPYVGQGAAMAIEDAVVLAESLDHARSHGWTNRKALGFYQDQRMTRALSMRDAGRKNKEYLHMPDGPEQQARDEMLARGKQEAADGTKINLLGSLQNQAMYGTDVRLETRKELQKEQAKLADGRARE